MSFVFYSVSSTLMNVVTDFRNNKGPLAKVPAEIGYIVIFPVALVETIISTALTALSFLTIFFTNKVLYHSLKLLISSSFTVLWSISYCFFNIIKEQLPKLEGNARNYLLSSNL
ncbi:hypothetical protein BN1013_00674 [Candidatus Rubidus massiliensis]|nr:MAG: hypothetical protein BGO10_09950 [Chlamydia sp. 32-24]CDZ80168.1 hypothetical protein BN1013_00674 [Candidatus Rubidus massiliensis]